MPRPTIRGFGPGAIITICALGLTAFGLVVLSSAGQGTDHGGLYFFKKQLIWFALALVVGVSAAMVNLNLVRRYTWVLAGLAVLLLVAVLFGPKVMGARRWLNLGFMSAQPSDAGKLALVFCLAHYLAGNQRQIQTFWRGFVLPMGIVGVFAGLIFREPDFGTAALCGMVGCALVYLAGVRLFYLFPSMLAGGLLFSVAVYLDPLRLKRIVSFLDIEKYRNDGAYQLWQGMLGFGVGGWNGVGLGEGRQQLFYLTEAHNDFVFAVVGEEMGLLATASVALTFLTIFIVSCRALRRAPNLYEFTVATGALLMLIGQALINMGVVTGLLPTKGMSLPFISYGGSNLLLMYALIGVLVNCFRRWERPVLPRPSEL